MLDKILVILIFITSFLLIRRLVTDKSFTLRYYSSFLILVFSFLNFIVSEPSLISILQLLVILFIVFLSTFKSARRYYRDKNKDTKS